MYFVFYILLFRKGKIIEIVKLLSNLNVVTSKHRFWWEIREGRNTFLREEIFCNLLKVRMFRNKKKVHCIFSSHIIHIKLKKTLKNQELYINIQ